MKRLNSPYFTATSMTPLHQQRLSQTTSGGGREFAGKLVEGDTVALKGYEQVVDQVAGLVADVIVIVILQAIITSLASSASFLSSSSSTSVSRRAV